MSRPILLTAFEPFGGERLNPSWEVAQRLDGRRIGGASVKAVRLPVHCARAAAAVTATIAELNPVAVLGLGQAAGRFGLSLEQVALNLADERPVPEIESGLNGKPVVVDGPDAYFTRLPLKPIIEALRKREVPAATSLSAGVYVCNTVMYATLHALRRRPRLPAGFIHLPYANGQATRRAAASMSLDLMVIGIETSLEVIASTDGVSAGTQAREKRIRAGREARNSADAT
ncbi:MAG: pyroglutamyl-peptidase I [Candidatus Binataceae bacterium]